MPGRWWRPLRRIVEFHFFTVKLVFPWRLRLVTMFSKLAGLLDRYWFYLGVFGICLLVTACLLASAHLAH